MMLAQTNIAPVKSAILIIYDWFNYLIVCRLLPDAEVGEDRVKDIIWGDFAGNLAKVIDDSTNILT